LLRWTAGRTAHVYQPVFCWRFFTPFSPLCNTITYLYVAAPFLSLPRLCSLYRVLPLRMAAKEKEKKDGRAWTTLPGRVARVLVLFLRIGCRSSWLVLYHSHSSFGGVMVSLRRHRSDSRIPPTAAAPVCGLTCRCDLQRLAGCLSAWPVLRFRRYEDGR
jgi:hypothetical protein